MLKCLRAVPPLSPIIESREDVVSEGNETELTCTAIGSKPVASIRWMKGEEELTGQWNNSGGGAEGMPCVSSLLLPAEHPRLKSLDCVIYCL